jgi:hypothetical protein
MRTQAPQKDSERHRTQNCHDVIRVSLQIWLLRHDEEWDVLQAIPPFHLKSFWRGLRR